MGLISRPPGEVGRPFLRSRLASATDKETEVRACAEDTQHVQAE